MGKQRRTTERSENDSTATDRPTVPTDRSAPESGSPARGRRVPPAKRRGPDRAKRRGPDRVPTALRRADDPRDDRESTGFRDEARALAGRISAGTATADPDGTASDDAGATEGSTGDRSGAPERGDGGGPAERLRETFPELDVDAGDLRDVRWRNVVKKAAVAEMRNKPGVRGLVAGATELHQQLSKGDPLAGRVAEIHDRLGEFPPPEGWAEAIADRALRKRGTGLGRVGVELAAVRRGAPGGA